MIISIDRFICFFSHFHFLLLHGRYFLIFYGNFLKSSFYLSFLLFLHHQNNFNRTVLYVTNILITFLWFICIFILIIVPIFILFSFLFSFIYVFFLWILFYEDEDREGEAISWHLVEVLNPKVRFSYFIIILIFIVIFVINYKCWWITSVGEVQVLVNYKCWWITSAGELQVLVNYKCWCITSVGEL